jgi:hypothetical protein
MGCWDIFCFLCGNRSRECDDNSNNFNKQTEWLNECTFLTATNKIIHNCKEIECNIIFADNTGNEYYHATYKPFPLENYGLFVHTHCWKFIQKKYKIDLCYSHLPISNTNHRYNVFGSFIKYPLEKYWKQDFNFKALIEDKKEEMAYSPFKSLSTAKNISNVFTKLKIRTKGERKGPLISASFYKNGEYKMGSNGNIWIINNKKWMEIKETIKYKVKINLDKKTQKYLLNINHCGDKSKIPIFILNYKVNKKMADIDFLTTNNYIDNIKKHIIN